MIYALWQFVAPLLGLVWAVILIGIIVIFIIALVKGIYGDD